AMTGPMPGMANAPRPTSRPLRPPTTAPPTAPLAAASPTSSLSSWVSRYEPYSPVTSRATRLMSLRGTPASTMSATASRAPSNASDSPTTVFVLISSRFAAAPAAGAQLVFLSSSTLRRLGEKAARLDGPTPYLSSGKYPIHNKRQPRAGQPLDP